VAASAIDGWVDLPLLLELGSQLALLVRRRGVPVHVEDFRGRTKEILGGTMAIKAPLHAEGLRLVDHAHLIDGPVTAVTADATIHVNSVVEISVIRQAMDLDPGNGLSGLPTLADRREAGAVRQDLALPVAVDAGLGCRRLECPATSTKL
jgi:hypothetical protein